MRLLNRYLVFLVLCLPVMTSADIYKCTDDLGAVEFTDEPCTAGPLEIINIEESYTSDLPGLRPYELDRLQQLDHGLLLEKLAHLSAQQALAALTMNDEVQCRSALLHLVDLQYRLYSGQASYNSRFLRELSDDQIRKRNRYCR